jgi:glucose/mannose-6-phosphate isomerase
MDKTPAIDSLNMRQAILDFPKQFRAGLFAAENVELKKWRLRSPIIICGMGGSASAGDILHLWMRHEFLGISEYEILVHRGYGLPKIERKHFEDGVWEPLVITASYSGNTEETLSAYEDALKKKLPLIAISTGGKLRDLAKKDGVPFVQVPATGIQPRSSFGYQFGVLVSLLKNLGVIDGARKEEVADLELLLNPAKLEKKGREIAQKTVGTIPLLYSSGAWKELSRIIKIKFNEHAKTPAFWNYFPELNHNEMTGFASLGVNGKSRTGQTANFNLLVLKDANDNPRVLKRMDLTAKILKKKGIASAVVTIEGKTILEKIFSTLLLGDWIAYYNAILRGIDPTPVEMVEEFKKLMK